jgi:hypothetical protein
MCESGDDGAEVRGLGKGVLQVHQDRLSHQEQDYGRPHRRPSCTCRIDIDGDSSSSSSGSYYNCY